MPNIYPEKEAEFVPWTQNFQAKTTATPLVYALTAPMALVYKNLSDDYLAKRAIAENPNTRTPVAIEQKDQALELVRAEARRLAGVVQHALTTDNAIRRELLLPEYGDGPTPIGPPTVVPVAKIISVNGWTVDVQITTADSTRRKLPDGVAGINIYTYSAGPTAPTDPALWSYEGEISKSRFKINLDPTLPKGHTVFLAFCFKSPRFQTGPACFGVPVVVGGGIPETVIG